MITLNDETFILFAMHHYDNVQCTSMKEFHKDIQRFKSLNKLFHRYKYKSELKERLILNHIIVLYNIFNDATTDLLFFKINKEYWSYLATFLIAINRLPEKTQYLHLQTNTISLDNFIIDRLRQILRG